MRVIKYICVVMLAAIQLNVMAQDDDYARTDKKKDGETPKQRSDFWDRIYVGGNLGASFGRGYAYVDISPLVGYRFTDRFSAGVGATYRYIDIKDYNFRFTNNIYGGRIFGRFNVFEFLFLHSELEMLNWNCPTFTTTGYTTENVWAPGLLVGGGIRQSFGNSSSGFYAMLLYNVLYDRCSPYDLPYVIQVGAAFGL